jgi:hypothetical protein
MTALQPDIRIRRSIYHIMTEVDRATCYCNYVRGLPGYSAAAFATYSSIELSLLAAVEKIYKSYK